MAKMLPALLALTMMNIRVLLLAPLLVPTHARGRNVGRFTTNR